MELEVKIVILGVLVSIVVAYITFKAASYFYNKKISKYSSIAEAVETESKALASLKNELSYVLSLKGQEEQIQDNIEELKLSVKDYSNIKEQLDLLKPELDLYSRIDSFKSYGHFEMPEYLYETSARFAEEIKLVRTEQKNLIKEKIATRIDENDIFTDAGVDYKIAENHGKLILAAFNIETDLLIGKVSPSNFTRVTEQIVKVADRLEKLAPTFQTSISLSYVELKLKECELQYQFRLKKQEEQEEQKVIREQIREEQRAIKEFERAVAEAAKEEQIYRDLLDKARRELEDKGDEERSDALRRIEELEGQLAEAEAKEERAKSMAEQTRKGHVYIISNIGSFGEDVYKIGLTRRLDPLDRVKELGDASVPFSFDVHAMVYVDDAPALETALHRSFTDRRVNAINLRKEFFRVSLEEIKAEVEKLANKEVDFQMTAIASDYYESKRLNASVSH